jgi:hypothetical protein
MRPSALRVGESEPAHEAGEFVISSRPEDEVPVVGHQAPVEDADGAALVGLEEYFFEGEEVVTFISRYVKVRVTFISSVM